MAEPPDRWISFWAEQERANQATRSQSNFKRLLFHESSPFQEAAECVIVVIGRSRKDTTMDTVKRPAVAGVCVCQCVCVRGGGDREVSTGLRTPCNHSVRGL